MTDTPLGVTIETGPQDWQIFQQSALGVAEIALSGRWIPAPAGKVGIVEVRLAFEDSGASVNATLDWKPAAETNADGSWQHRLSGAPAGGLYRVETRLSIKGSAEGEWSLRGDMRHFIGVGDLWLIAGQSNAVGYGRNPVHDPPELGIHLFRHSDCWSLATHPFGDSTDTTHAVNREGANPGHSPNLRFARELKQHLGYPIGLLPTALGGSPLSQWENTEAGPAPLLRNMLKTVQQVGGHVRGIIWYQGESDAQTSLAASYLERFTRAAAAWRAALGDPELPILTVQLNRYFAPAEGQDVEWARVQEAQRQAARSIPRVAVVPTQDLSLSDVIHTSSPGNLMLGSRLAGAALGMVYGQPVGWRAPDLQHATLANGARVIQLRFAHVTSRMGNMNPRAASFQVEDDQGYVPVEGILYPSPDRIELRLARAVDGPAVVHGSAGCNAPTAPMDVEPVLPMLAFWNVKVE